jgi:hypothetical protein
MEPVKSEAPFGLKLRWFAQPFFPAFSRVILTQCVGKDLRKAFHQLGIGLRQGGQMPTELIFASIRVLPAQILECLDCLGL